MQAYIVNSLPYESRIDNFLAFLNEWLISMYIYGIFLLTDYNNNVPLRV